MVAPVHIAIAVLGAVPTARAFAPPAPSTLRGHHLLGDRIRLSNSDGGVDDDDFDPFLSSPLSFGNADDSNDEGGSSGASSEFNFGFISDAVGRVDEDTATNGGAPDNKPVEFDPLLSPHAYVHGTDAAPVDIYDSATRKVGILLIDHGSKRQASNDHIHNIAQIYESRLRGGATATRTVTIVRAAHMEIARPSIEDSLRDIIAVDRVTKVVCVPYFLSPGRHATEDVPNLITEAKGVLIEEGLISDASSILVSNALGTHMESMLGAVDDLVEWTLNEG